MKMNKNEKRKTIHRKLEVMKKCYQERSIDNFDVFFDAFFNRNRLPIIIGTDSGEWFCTMERIRWLITYDWEKWGDLEIDAWNFTIHEEEDHDMVRTRGVLDFGSGRAWDVDIVMIFSKAGGEYSCRLMQFKIPRNEIRPAVVLNQDKEEQDKSETEMKFLTALNGDVNEDLMRDHLAGSVRSMLREQRPYLVNIDVRKEMIVIEENGDGYLFALTGFCIHSELKALMPFRIVGIGQGYKILDAEFSHPFASELG